MPREIAGMTLYTVQEIAKQLDKTPNTIRSYIRDGKLKGRKVGREYLVTQESIREFFGASEDEERPPGQATESRPWH